MQVLLHSLGLALGTLWNNPLRSLLTVLGIVIGVATTVAMMGIIEGMRLKVSQDLLYLGVHSFEVARPPSAVSFGGRPSPPREDLTLADMHAIRASSPSSTAVSATQYRSGQRLSSARQETPANVLLVGGTAEWLDTHGFELARGRFFSEADELTASRVVVLGATVAEKLFAQQEPLGQTVRIKNQPLTVVGLLRRQGSMVGMLNLDNQAILPLPVLRQLYGSPRYLEINVQANDARSFASAQQEVLSLLRARHQVPPGEESPFSITTNEAGTRTFNQLSRGLSATGALVCLLSLLVGGIGILNIMMFSVTERVPEIGVRKALGARRRHILAQFVLEALLLALAGGVVGLLLGGAVVLGVRWVTGIPSVVQPWVAALALGVSSSVGLIFGIYPAARAARLDPVEAMRAE